MLASSLNAVCSERSLTGFGSLATQKFSQIYPHGQLSELKVGNFAAFAAHEGSMIFASVTAYCALAANSYVDGSLPSGL